METSLDEAGCRPQEGPGAISVTVPAQVPHGSSMHSRSCSEHGERGGFLVHLQAIRAVAETFLSPTAERSGPQPGFELDCATTKPLF